MIKVRNDLGEYPCYICPDVLNSKKDLRLHTMSMHKDEKNCVCPTCEAKLKDVSSVRRHIKTVHMKVQQYVCTFCEKKYSHKFDLENHFRKKHKRNNEVGTFKVCPDCQYSFTDMNKFNQHMIVKHQKTINHIKCPYCMKIFFDPVYIKQHFKKAHGNHAGLLYICGLCNMVSDIHETFDEHMRTSHSWNETHFCTRRDCNKYFESESELKDHIDLHPKRTLRKADLVANKFSCFECDEPYKERIDLFDHFREVHNCAPMIECKACSTFFRNKDDLVDHSPCSNMHAVFLISPEDECASEEPGHSKQNSKKQKIAPVAIYDNTPFHISASPPPSPKIACNRDVGLLYICHICHLDSEKHEFFRDHMREAHCWSATHFCFRKDCFEYFESESELEDHIQKTGSCIPKYTLLTT